MDFPGAFEIVLAAYDQVDNGTSVEAVEQTLAELVCVYPDHEIVEQLCWKLTDLIVEQQWDGHMPELRSAACSELSDSET